MLASVIRVPSPRATLAQGRRYIVDGIQNLWIHDMVLIVCFIVLILLYSTFLLLAIYRASSALIY